MHQRFISTVLNSVTVLQIEHRAGQLIHQIAVVRYQNDRSLIFFQRLSQEFPRIDVKMVRGLIQKHQVGLFQKNLRKAQTGELAAGQRRAGFENVFPAEPKKRQMASDFQFREFRVFIPDRADDSTAPAQLLLFEDGNLCTHSQPDASGVRTKFSVQHAEKRRLSRSVRPCNHQAFASAHLQIKPSDQLFAAQCYRNVLRGQEFQIRGDVKRKMQFDRCVLRSRSLGDFHFFKLFAAALRHFCRGCTHDVPCDVIFQLGSFGHVCVMLFLAQCICRFLLRDKGRIVSLVCRQAVPLHFEDAVAHGIQKISVMADNKDGSGIALKILLQPLHRLEIKVVCRLVENQDIRMRQQKFRKAKTCMLTAGQNAHAFLIALRRKRHTAQNFFDLNVHVISVGRIHNSRQLRVQRKQFRLLRIAFQLALDLFHSMKRFQHRPKCKLHLAVNCLQRVQYAVLRQITETHTAREHNLSGIRIVLACDQFDQGRLPRSVLTDNAYAVVFIHNSANIFQHDLCAETFAYMLYGQKHFSTLLTSVSESQRGRFHTQPQTHPIHRSLRGTVLRKQSS